MRQAPASMILLLVACALMAACSGQPAPQSAQTPTPTPDVVGARVIGTVTLSDIPDAGGIQVYLPGTRLFALTDSEGRYEITDVPPGVYKVLARMAGYNPAAIHENLSISGDDAGMDIPLETIQLSPRVSASATPAPNALGSIEGKVVGELYDNEGVPIAPSDLAVSLEGTPYRTSILPDGSFLLWNLPADDYRVVVQGRGIVPTTREARILPGEKLILEPIELVADVATPDGRVAGQVSLYDSQGNLSNEFNLITVRLLGSQRTAVLGPDGTFAFDRLERRRYIVTASGSGFSLSAPAQVDLTTTSMGQVELVMAATAPAPSEQGRITGFAIKGDENNPAGHSGIMVALAGNSQTAMTDNLGMFTFTNVPPGSYQVLATAEGYQKAETGPVEVAAGRETQLEGMYLERNREAPRVLATTPENGARDIMIRREIPIMIRFSHKMVPESLRAAISIDPPVAHSIFAGKDQADTDFDLMKIILHGSDEDPVATFNTRYTITINEQAHDFENTPMEEPFQFDFQTGEPAVIATLPTDGDEKSVLNPRQPIVIYFNAKMDHRTLAPDVVRIRPAPVTTPNILAFDDPVTGWTNMQIQATWGADTEYGITVLRRARTASKDSLMNTPYEFKFRTARLVPYYGPQGRSERRRETRIR
jgi:hypothetical protein